MLIQSDEHGTQKLLCDTALARSGSGAEKTSLVPVTGLKAVSLLTAQAGNPFERSGSLLPGESSVTMEWG